MLAHSQGWRVGLAAVLAVVILLSAFARAPRRAVTGADLRRLVIAALVMYAAGVLASLRHYPSLAALAYAAGIGVCALAAWLSRGEDSEDPPGGRDSDDEWPQWPPSDPEGAPWLDWDAFEREFRSYCEQRREPSSRP